MDNIPNALDQLTKIVPATSLEISPERALDMDYFIKCIEASLTSDLKKYFDKGYNYFKISGNDSLSFLKSFFYLYNDYLKQVLKESNVDVEKQEVITENLNTILKNIESLFVIIDSLLDTLKIPKNTFDSNKLSMIITGYAINNIKKNFRSKA